MMRKKIFIVTIPMLPEKELKTLCYRYEKEDAVSSATAFPGIAMLEKNILGNEPVKIVTVRVCDDKGASARNAELFRTELSALSDKLQRELYIKEEIALPYSEGEEKQKAFLKRLCGCFDDKCDIYSELTYGTKVTSIGMFASLVYAEKIADCSIKEILYGKYDFSEEKNGVLYNVKSLYDISMLINASAYMPKKNVKLLLDTIQ